MSWKVRAGWLAAYAVATLLAFPQPLFGTVIDLGWLIGWLVPGLLILGLRGLEVRSALGLGFVAGLVGQSLVLHWIYVVTVHYGRAPTLIGVLAPIALASHAAIGVATFAGGWAALRQRDWANPWTAALLWTVSDHLRAWLFTGFPWATLGYAQHLNPPLMGLSSATGVYGLSFVTALGSTALAEAFERGAAVRIRLVGSAVAAVVLAHAVGWGLRADARGPSDAVAIRIAALQGNVEQGAKWDRDRFERTLSDYERLTREAAADGARIIVWPETAVPGSLELEKSVRARVEELARATGSLLIIGGVGIEEDPEGGGGHYFDSAYVIDPSRGQVDRYDKSHLVPFGEYVPLRELLGRFLSGVATGITPGDVAEGAGPRAIALPEPRAYDISGSAPELGIAVCYELIFPDLVRRFGHDGAGVLLALTNDAWYGRTGAPYQFLAMTEVRSAETGLWTVRAANTGVSAIIDASGRVRERTRIFEQGWISADVPIHRDPAPGITPYVRWGDWLVKTCWVALMGVAAFAIRGRAGDGQT